MEHHGGLGMTPAEMEAEAQLSELRVEALQQLTSALSGSRISLPPDDGAPSQLLWHSPTYGAGRQLLPAGPPARLYCTELTDRFEHSHGAGRQLLPAGLPAKVMQDRIGHSHGAGRQLLPAGLPAMSNTCENS